MTALPQNLRTFGLVVGLAAFTLVVYWPLLSCGFVNFDDPTCVTENPHLRAGLTRDGLLWAFSTGGYFGNWMPLAWLSHMLDIKWFGLNPAGHHLTNLLLHTANSVLLFIVLRRLTGNCWRSTLVAALFALHPLHVEPVAWIALRRDLLSAFFFMLTLWAYSRYAQHSAFSLQPSAVKSPPSLAREVASPISQGCHLPSSIFYLLALACFALGLMSKPMLVTLPFVLLLLDYWPLRRFQLLTFNLVNGRGTNGALGSQLSTVRRLLWEKLPFFALTITSSVIACVAQREVGALSSLTDLPLQLRLANALTSYVAYMRKMIWPDDLAVFYPYPVSFPVWKISLAAGLLVAVSAWVLMRIRRWPWLAVGWFWYLGTLVPVIGLVQVGMHSMADRYTYIPLIGLFLMITWGVVELAPRGAYRGVVLGLGTTALLGACAMATTCQLRHWRTTFTLFEHALVVTSNNSVAHDNLGSELYDRGEFAKAKVHFETAVKLTPNSPVSLSNMGLILAREGKYDEAILHFAAAVSLNSETARFNPRLGNAHTGWGVALVKLGRGGESIPHFQEAIRFNPNDYDAHYNLGTILLARGQADEAMGHLVAVLRIRPDDVAARRDLGIALARQGKLEEAIRHFTAALRTKPDLPQLRILLARAFAEQGKPRAAIAEYSAALQLDPHDVELLNHLAWILATHPDPQFRDGRQAVEYAARAVELTRTNDAAVLDTLAVAYAEAGRFAEAVNAAQEALQLTEVIMTRQNTMEMTGQKELAAQIRERLSDFELRRPYRE